MASAADIQAIFNRFGVSPMMLTGGQASTETAAERFTRIAAEVTAGRRSIADVELSVSRLAQDPTRGSLQAQVEALFLQHGVPTGYNLDGTVEDGVERVARITRELASGSRTFADVARSVERLGAQYRARGPVDANNESLEVTIENLFKRYGVPTNFHLDGSSEEGTVRVLRLAQSIRNGTRSMSDLEQSVMRLSTAYRERGGEQEPEPANQQNAGAFAILKGVLDRYGLGGMTDWLTEQVRNDRSVDELLIELREQPAFKERFKAIDRRRANGLNTISPEEIMEYEETARDLMRQSGLPSGFYDQFDDFADLIGKGVSLQSVARRVEESWSRVVNAPEEVRAAFGDIYGMKSDQALAALFFDPDKADSHLKQMASTAVAGGAMRAFGFGLDATAAAKIAGYNIDDSGVRSGFAKLAQLRSVFTETIGEQSDLDAMKEGANAVFDMGEGSAAIEDRLIARRNELGGGGGAYISNEGLVGLR